MNKNFHRIDLLTEQQNKSIAYLSESYLREKTPDGELISELLIWTHSFRGLLESFPDYEELNSESVIYKFRWTPDNIGERWGDEDNGEVEFERLREFYEHLKTLNSEGYLYGQKEYNAILDFCKSAIDNNNKIYFIADYF